MSKPKETNTGAQREHVPWYITELGLDFCIITRRDAGRLLVPPPLAYTSFNVMEFVTGELPRREALSQRWLLRTALKAKQ